MNITNLIIYLQKKMSAVTDPLDLLALNRAVNKLKAGSVETVTYYSELPDATLNAGKLFYVMNDERLYWSYLNSNNVSVWEPITMTTAGYVWSWGTNTSGLLGDNTTVTKSSPVSIIGGFNDWKDVSAGRTHKLMLKNNGTLWSVGGNENGQLGDNTTVNKSSPISVIGGFNDWCQIATAACTSFGLRANGTFWSWGINSSGQLGSGTTVDRSSPGLVAGGFTDWQKIDRRIGLRANGTIWNWGSNSTGDLGDGTTVDKSSPVSIVGGFTDWCDVVNGFGLRSNGTLWAWGQNNRGEIGDGTTVNKSSPVSVVGGFTDWCSIAAQSGIRANGSAWTWGCNNKGQLGDNTTVNKSSPVSVVGGFADWCAIAYGNAFSAGIRSNGTLWSWGENIGGKLGESSPVSVVGGFTDWYSVSLASSAGSDNSTALRIVSL